MEQTIKIKDIGFNRGTTGWLSDGIFNKQITIVESVTKSDKPGLFMRVINENKSITSICIALYNPYDVGEDFVPMNGSHHDDPGALYDTIGMTKACRQALRDIATTWCQYKNAKRDNDKVVKVKVSFE